MKIFHLPATTVVNKVVPKNAFDKYITTSQKKQFASKIARITWLHKLSTDTIRLPAIEISELQVFGIELKKRERIPKIFDVIDASIPYPILFLAFRK